MPANRSFHLFFAAITLCTLSLVTACGGDSPEQHITRAEQLIDGGELKAATIELRNALQQNPDMLEARTLLGTVSLDLGDGATAEKEIEHAVKLGLDQGAAQPLLTRAIMLQADFDRVLDITSQQAPGMSEHDQANVLGLRGQAYLGKTMPRMAQVSLETALEVDPNSAEALIGMATLNMMQGQLDAARQAVKQLLDADDSFAPAWNILGEIESFEQNYNESEKAFTKAVQRQKYEGLYRAKRAYARLQQGKIEEAEADLQVLEQHAIKNHPYVLYVEGLNYFLQNQYDAAVNAFEASRAGGSLSLQADVYLIAAHLAAGNIEQATSLAERLYAMFPQLQTTSALLGQIRLSNLNYSAAKTIFERALYGSPDNALALEMLGAIALLQGDTATGVEYYQRLALLDPDSQSILAALNLARLIDGQALKWKAGDAWESGIPTSDDEYTQQLLYALEAYRDKNCDKAIEYAQQLHEAYPDKLDPLTLMSACYSALGETGKAKSMTEAALAISPNNPEMVKNLVRLEIYDGNLERARKLLKSLLAEFPQDEKAILLLVAVETQLGGRESGIQLLEEAVVSNPEALSIRVQLAEVHFNTGRMRDVLRVTQNLDRKQLAERPQLLEMRAKAQMQLGDVTSASSSFEQLSKAAPNSVVARYFYAGSLSRLGNVNRALVQMKLAVKIDPQYLPARMDEIKLLAQQEKFSRANKAMEALRRDFPESPEISGLGGWLALLEGDYARAELLLGKAVEQTPNSALTIYLVTALWEQNKYEQAVAVLRARLDSNPKDIEVNLLLASTYLSLNSINEAISSYEALLEHYPGHVPALNNLAFLLHQEGKIEQALGHAEKAYELLPEDPAVLDTLGLILLQGGGDKARGIKLIKAAAERSKAPQVKLHLAQAFIAEGSPVEAQKTLKALIAEAPDSQVGHEAKALLESMPGM